MPTITIKAENTKEIDLGASTVISVKATGGTAEVHFDYQRTSTSGWVSAVKNTAGIHNPLTVKNGETATFNKTELETESVRVGVHKADISLTY